MSRFRLLSWMVAGALLAGSTAVFGQSRRGATRVDFDDALIKGQTNRGAVHLIERQDAGLGSLVKTRRHFRRRILLPYGYQAEEGLQRQKDSRQSQGNDGTVR